MLSTQHLIWAGTSHPALFVSGLRFEWPGATQPILDIAELSLAPGESLFLRGPSGSGKSTLLAAIAGAVEIPEGCIRVAQSDVGALRGGARDRFRADHIGIIHQVFNLVPWLSALENVLLPCRYSRRRAERAGPDAAATARRLLRELGLDTQTRQNAPAVELSVGQQQRVAAARALIGTPELVLADEPTSALDEDAKAAFVALLRTECKSVGASLLFVSHDRSLEPHFERSVSIAEINRAGRSEGDTCSD